MDYWRGQMDWKLDKGWHCHTCGQNQGLEWGLVHGQCRCNVCHTQYQMRADNEARTVLTVPRLMIREEYKQLIKQAWEKYQTPLEEMTIED